MKNKKIIGFFSVFTVFSILTLNLSAITHCSLMLKDEGCCHVEKTMKSCCVKNLKIINNDRISGHCGCNMKETQQPSDLYSDFTNTGNSKYQKIIESFENPYSGNESQDQHRSAIEYSPPERGTPTIYLTNLNLRI